MDFVYALPIPCAIVEVQEYYDGRGQGLRGQYVPDGILSATEMECVANGSGSDEARQISTWQRSILKEIFQSRPCKDEIYIKYKYKLYLLNTNQIST